jgi:hypothetical protein|nr:MAG TPA: hypothetical protein [Caudoviricetes sp.]
MPIYKVTTEGDCEGRTIKHLGYVEAESPKHAIKYLKSIGKDEYYEYSITQVNNPVVVAKPSNELEHLFAEISQQSYGGWVGKVKTNTQLLKEKEQAVQSAKETIRNVMQRAGLSYKDVVNFGKGE